MKPTTLIATALCMCTFSSNLPAADDFKPGKSLADDLQTTKIVLQDSYLKTRPRLLYSPAEKELLTKKSQEHADLWKSVVASSSRLKATPQSIAEGKTYWRIEGVQSAALHAFVTGDEEAKKRATTWMLAHVAEPVWGKDYRPNLDLVASWYLYHISMAYDSLHGDLSDADRKTIRDGLIAHAKTIYDDFEPAKAKNLRYDQNHTYIPTVAMVAAALAVYDETPEAADWLKRGVAIMNRCRYALGPDGYYYEGVGYWCYALHWHVRYADLIRRATGENMADLPALSQTWKYGLHLSLPGSPGNFDIGDSGQWKGDERPPMRVNNHAMLWGLAGMLKNPESKLVGDIYQTRAPERDYPAAAFLWYPADVQSAEIAKQTPWQHFEDHGVLTWRSSWGEDATCLYFRAGPPAGHAANEKLKQMTDWTINAGHVHPDIGGFLLYAKKNYMAVTTGYTAEKWTKDHNTLLIDGLGQGMDGSYWNDRGIPYEQFNNVKIEQVYTSADYAYANGSIGSAYARQVKGLQLNRHLLVTKKWLLIIDQMKSETPHALTWFCHAQAEFKADGGNYIAALNNAKLAVIPLTGVPCEIKSEETVVQAGIKPGSPTPTQRGHHLSIAMKDKSVDAQLVNLLVPQDANQSPPKVESCKSTPEGVTIELVWESGQRESIQLNLKWKKDNTGPATLQTR